MNDLLIYLENRINLNYSKETRAYIINVLHKPGKDLSKEILALVYAEAKNRYKFDKFQELADWILFCRAVFPKQLDSEGYLNSLAQLSYWNCYKLLNKQWKLYEELADSFPKIIEEIKISIHI